MYGVCDIGVKRIVSVRPVCCQAPVDIYTCVAHGAVKYQRGVSVCGVRYFECCFVISFAYIGQAAGAPRLPRLLGFSVLFYRYFLQVV